MLFLVGLRIFPEATLASYSKSLLGLEQQGKGYEQSWGSQASGLQLL